MATPDDAPNVYLDTVARLEPEIAMIDEGAFYASAAISLKRMADAFENMAATIAPIGALLKSIEPALGLIAEKINESVAEAAADGRL